jgi:uncharacterized protein Usg
MLHDREFEKMVREGYVLVTINVLYHLPDHRSLINEFIWQTLDLKPRYPRVERFLDFWRREIDAVIREVTISDGVYLTPMNHNNASIFKLN